MARSEPDRSGESFRKRSALSYQPSAPEGAAYRIRAERSRLPFEAEC